MKREYITEIKEFYDLVESKLLSTGQIALWHALMYYNNKCFWEDNFSVSNLALQSRTGLSRSGIAKARNELKQKGLIDFAVGKTGQTATYKINILSKSVQESKQVSTHLVSKPVHTKDAHGEHESSTLKRHKTKTKTKTDISPIIPFAENVSMTNAEYSALIERFGETDTKRMIEILDNYKGSSGKKYKSDYRAVLSWVVDRLDEEKTKGKPLTIYSDDYDHENLEILTRGGK